MTALTKLSGTQFLDYLVGSDSEIGLLDKNPDDAKYRKFTLSNLNLVLEDIQNRQQSFHWRFLEVTAIAPTVSGQMDYDLPGTSGSAPPIDTTKLVVVSDRTNDITYTYKPYEIFKRYVADPSNDSGDPYIFTLWANMLKLWPVPNSAFNVFLDYIKLMTKFADDSTTTDIPAKYNHVIIAGALVYAYKFDPQLGDWVKQQQIYEAAVDKMVRDNSLVISELSKSASHRDKYYRRGLVDGKNSTLFPLAGTNV